MRPDSRSHFLVDLSLIRAFRVRVLFNNNFKDDLESAWMSLSTFFLNKRKKGAYHAKGVNIHFLVILFVVYFWGKEFRCPKDGRDVLCVFNNSQTEISNLGLSIVAINKYVVAFQVSAFAMG